MSTLSRAQDILGDLIRFPTISVDSNLQMIEYLKQTLTVAGAEVMIQSDPTGTKANLWATLGPKLDGGIVLSGHTDVVPVADQDWTEDPFEMSLRDGRLYGRGTCDMKGFIACCLALLEKVEADTLQRPLHFAFTYDEETGCLGAQSLVEELRSFPLKPAICIIGEPTGMRVIEGHKGCCEYTTHFTGLEGHGSAPDAGLNAVEYAVKYVSHLLEVREGLKARAPENGRFDPPWTTLNIGGLHGGVAHNVIPGKAHVEWEFRPVQNSDYDYVTGEVRRYVQETLLPEMQKNWPDANIVTETIGEVAGLEPMDTNEARDLVLALTGENDVDVVAFATEGGLFQSIGMDVVVCGPGYIAQAHKPDEYVELSQLAECLDMLDGIAARLAS
ncbi:acetylornithine deacetylase [Donghicola sp.]|jgi:acetylornithine deacetylase|uniref:acetylornithine deacetylase n=1 Tax=Donghicola sp. TaxID=1929294 RepID=UPI0025F89BB5|nr:acetylornithine deacetylase [Donghicola sp.]MCT4578996.1 acetylornithine deacetylase [Donghicola sp.]